MAASVAIAEHCSGIAESKDCDQCSAGDHDACRRVMTRKRASLQWFPGLQSFLRIYLGSNIYCIDRLLLLQVLVDGVGVCVGSAGFGIRVDRRRCLFMEKCKKSSPAGFPRLPQWKSADADNIETTESADKLRAYDRTGRRGMRDLMPSLLGLTVEPKSQMLFSSRGMVWIQSVLDSTCLSDERAKPNSSDHKGQPSRSGRSSIHE